MDDSLKELSAHFFNKVIEDDADRKSSRYIRFSAKN